jgi:predicted metal-binding membrane protein
MAKALVIVAGLLLVWATFALSVPARAVVPIAAASSDQPILTRSET